MTRKTMQPLVVEGETRQVPVFIHEPCLEATEWDEEIQGPIWDTECWCEEDGLWLKVWVEK